MKVLFVCPLWYPIAEDSRGGIETYLPVLIRRLAELGIQIAVIGSGDSVVPEADLIPVVPASLFDQMMSGEAAEYYYFEQHMLIEVQRRKHEFDIVHSHLGNSGFTLSALGGRPPVLHSLHSTITPDLKWFVRRHPDLWLNTVSHFQATELEETGARRCSAIPNGIDPQRFKEPETVEEDLVFLDVWNSRKDRIWQSTWPKS